MNSYERLRVLYVEDNLDSFEMLRVMLGLSQIELEFAGSVSDALTRAGSEKFDLFLLDTGLPDGSGNSLCRTLRAVEPEIPVLFYSGEAHPDKVQMGIAAGADGYIIKPHSDMLAPTITQLVASRGEKSIALKSLPVLAAAA